MTTDTGHCAVCAAATTEVDDEFVLAEAITWRGPFTADAPPTPAGVYRLCQACAAWRPDARTATPPARFRAVLHTCTADLHPAVARALRAGLLGAARHLAQRLSPRALEEESA